MKKDYGGRSKGRDKTERKLGKYINTLASRFHIQFGQNNCGPRGEQNIRKTKTVPEYRKFFGEGLLLFQCSCHKQTTNRGNYVTKASDERKGLGKLFEKKQY